MKITAIQQPRYAITTRLGHLVTLWDDLNEHQRQQLRAAIETGSGFKSGVTMDLVSQSQGEDFKRVIIERFKLKFVKVPSTTRNLIEHTVTIEGETPISCSCEAVQFNSNPNYSCKHMDRVAKDVRLWLP